MIIYYLDEFHVVVPMPWFRRPTGDQLVVARRVGPVSNPGQSTLNLCWTKLSWELVFLGVLHFPPASFTESVLHNHLDFNTTFIRRTSGQNRGNFKHNNAHYNIGQHFTEKDFQIVFIFCPSSS
jgi:hypothetical protein